MPDLEDLKKWTSEISDELAAAGFEVSEYGGFPLVAMPKSQEERVRLLKFRTTHPADRRIYSEGMLFVPAGLGRHVRDEEK